MIITNRTNFKESSIYYFALASLFYLIADYGLYLASLWMVASKEGSPINAGIAVSAALFVPHVFKKYLIFNDEISFFSVLIKRRTLSLFLFFVIFLLTFFSGNMLTIYLVFFLLSVVTLLTTESIESCFGYFALSKKWGHGFLAKMQQIISQVSMLLGAALAGFILNAFSYPFVGLCCLVLTASAMLIQTFGFYGKNDQILNVPPKVKKPSFSDWKNSTAHSAFFILLLLMGLISLFNFTLPFLLRTEKLMTAKEYGLLEVYCIAGSLLGGFLFNKTSQDSQFSGYSMIIFLFLSFLLLIYSQKLLVFVAGFGIGFSLNILRIKQRAIMLSETEDHHSALYWGKLLSKSNLLIRSFIPLAMGICISFYSPSQVMFAAALLVCLGLVLMIRRQYLMALCSYSS